MTDILEPTTINAASSKYLDPTPEMLNGDPLFDATARSAVAAVLECQSYGFLPQDKYDLWKDLIINFNPNMMFDS